MEYLGLGGNEIGSRGVKRLSKCIHKVCAIAIYNCKITCDDLGVLTEEIRKLPKAVRFVFF